MARKIVAFVGSPRKGGNTDVLVTELLRAAEKEGAVTEKVYLGDVRINPCLACDSCHKVDPPQCVQKDDFEGVAAKLRAADAFVFGTPVYWWTISAQSKLFMDRWYSLLDKKYDSTLKGKRAAIVTCCQDPDTKLMTDPIVHMFREAFEFIGVELVDFVAASAHEKGEVAKNRHVMRHAADVGKRLAKA